MVYNVEVQKYSFISQSVVMLFKLVVVVAAAVVATAPAAAFNASNCSEMPACLNEYQWKHKATKEVSKNFCADRYPTCKNADGSDMQQYCTTAVAQCTLFVYGYAGMTDEGHTKAQNYCKKRLPRC